MNEWMQLVVVGAVGLFITVQYVKGVCKLLVACLVVSCYYRLLMACERLIVRAVVNQFHGTFLMPFKRNNFRLDICLLYAYNIDVK